MAGDGLRIVELTPERLGELPCCGIMNARHEGRRAKTVWLKEQLALGLRARLLLTEDGHQVGYIEYVPGEQAWRGVDAAGYLFIHCLWTFYRRYQHQGNAVRLVEACVKDARSAGTRGVAVVAREKPWLASPELFLKCGSDRYFPGAAGASVGTFPCASTTRFAIRFSIIAPLRSVLA